MSDTATIRILTDASPESGQKQALDPLAKVLGQSVGRVVKLETNALAVEVGACINSVQEMIGRISTDSASFLETVTFTVGINAAGQASLVSLASGNVGVSTGLTFTLRLQGRRDKD